jgi:hypothetical protein
VLEVNSKEGLAVGEHATDAVAGIAGGLVSITVDKDQARGVRASAARIMSTSVTGIRMFVMRRL